MKLVNWINFVLVLAIIGFTLAIVGVGVGYYLDIPSLVVTYGIACLLSLMSHGARGLGRAYRVAVAGGTAAEEAQAEAVFKGLQSNLIVAGLFGFVMGAVAILSNIASPESVAQGFAVAVLVVLYALVGIMLAVAPFRWRLAGRVAARQTGGTAD